MVCSVLYCSVVYCNVFSSRVSAVRNITMLHSMHVVLYVMILCLSLHILAIIRSFCPTAIIEEVFVNANVGQNRHAIRRLYSSSMWF